MKNETLELSRALDGEISHDVITPMLASPAETSKDLWLRVKPLIREIESEESVLIIDDSILEKPSTDESPPDLLSLRPLSGTVG